VISAARPDSRFSGGPSLAGRRGNTCPTFEGRGTACLQFGADIKPETENVATQSTGAGHPVMDLDERVRTLWRIVAAEAEKWPQREQGIFLSKLLDSIEVIGNSGEFLLKRRT
jgi:hypothetical protein